MLLVKILGFFKGKIKLIVALGDMAIVYIVLGLGSFIVSRVGIGLNISVFLFDIVVVIYFIIILFFLGRYSVFNNKMRRMLIIFIIIDSILTAIILVVFSPLLTRFQLLLKAVILFFLSILLIYLWQNIFNKFIIDKIPRKKILILEMNDEIIKYLPILSSPSSPYKVIGYLTEEIESINNHIPNSCPLIGRTSQLLEVVRQYDIDVIVYMESINSIQQEGGNNFEKKAVLELVEELENKICIELLTKDYSFINNRNYFYNNYSYNILKRLMDCMIAITLLFVTLPVSVLTAIAIKYDSSGPVFYIQIRNGKNNKKFKIIKFRSMIENAEKNGAVWAEELDYRITRVGKFIRATRIDELPQLWNVLHGDMSIIGPRPERPEFVTELSEKIPYYFLRSKINPGITGWAQVNYRYGASVDDARRKLEFDLYYLLNRSIILDIQILFRTLTVVVTRFGAR